MFVYVVFVCRVIEHTNSTHAHTEKETFRFYRDLNPDYKDQNLGC